MTYRYKITIEYLGTGIGGWQRQKDVISIQAILEAAIFKFSAEQVTLVAAGRTDAGVHALGQVAHFDLARQFSPHVIIGGINYHCNPYKVGVVACEQVSTDFHARFSATARHYIYRIINRPNKVIVEEGRVWWVRDLLNVEQMSIAAQHLLGTHDFNSFRSSQCQAKSPIKTLSKLEIIQDGELIEFHLSAPSFLHHMVRNIVGSLVLVGRSRWQAEDIKHALDAKDRKAAGPTAPAEGLYFTKVDYATHL